MQRFGRLRRGLVLVAAVGLVAAACSGRSATPTPTTSGGSTLQLATTTPAGTKPVGKYLCGRCTAT